MDRLIADRVHDASEDVSIPQAHEVGELAPRHVVSGRAIDHDSLDGVLGQRRAAFGDGGVPDDLAIRTNGLEFAGHLAPFGDEEGLRAPAALDPVVAAMHPGSDEPGPATFDGRFRPMGHDHEARRAHGVKSTADAAPIAVLQPKVAGPRLERGRGCCGIDPKDSRLRNLAAPHPEAGPVLEHRRDIVRGVSTRGRGGCHVRKDRDIRDIERLPVTGDVQARAVRGSTFHAPQLLTELVEEDHFFWGRAEVEFVAGVSLEALDQRHDVHALLGPA